MHLEHVGHLNYRGSVSAVFMQNHEASQRSKALNHQDYSRGSVTLFSYSLFCDCHQEFFLSHFEKGKEKKGLEE